MLQDKRGGIYSIIYLVAFLALVAILGLFFYYLSNEITVGFDEASADVDNPGYSRTVNSDIQGWLPFFFDELVFFLFLGSVIAVIIAAARTNFSYLVIGIFIILLLIAIFLAAGFTNIYSGFSQAEGLSEVASRLTLTGIIFSRYTPLIIAVLGGVVLIIMYGKSGGEIIR